MHLTAASKSGATSGPLAGSVLSVLPSVYTDGSRWPSALPFCWFWPVRQQAWYIIFIRNKTKDKIPKKAKLRLDKGYQGLQKKTELEVILPKKANRWHKLTRKDKIRNRKLAKERIVVEHVIGGLKVFQILAQRYRHQLENHNRTFKNIATIWNMKLALAET